MPLITIEPTGAARHIEPDTYPELSEEELYLCFHLKNGPVSKELLDRIVKAMQVAGQAAAVQDEPGKVTLLDVLEAVAPYIDHGKYLPLVEFLEQAMADGKFTIFEGLKLAMLAAAALSQDR